MGNAAHWHLLVNHFPIIGAFLALPLLVLTLLLRKERGLLLASVFLLAAVAVTGWMSIASGEKAWDMIQKGQSDGAAWTDDVDDAAIDEHEERAERAMWAAAPTAVLGVIALILAHRRPPENPLPRWWIGLLLVGAAATGGAMGYAGNAGGVIIHREIRGDSLDTTTKKKDAKPDDDDAKERRGK